MKYVACIVAFYVIPYFAISQSLDGLQPKESVRKQPIRSSSSSSLLAEKELTPAFNFISNPSFEAGLRGWRIHSEKTAVYAIVAENPIHGTNSLFISAAPNTTPAPAPLLFQDVPACGKCLYELSGWLKQMPISRGAVCLFLQALDAYENILAESHSALFSEDNWQQLIVNLVSPPKTELIRVGIKGEPGAAFAVDALRLHIRRGPRRRQWGPYITNFQATRIEATWARLAWKGPSRPYEISYLALHKPKEKAIVLTNIPSHAYSLVGLEPGTEYEIRLRLLWPEFYDERGQLTKSPACPTEPPPIKLITPAWQPRSLGFWRLWPPVACQRLPGPGYNPRIEAAGEHLYIGYEYGGNIYLSKISPTRMPQCQPEWTREILASATAHDSLKLVDMCVEGTKIYLLYQQADKNLGLALFDWELEQIEVPIDLQIAASVPHLKQMALSCFRNELWIIHSTAALLMNGRQEAHLIKMSPEKNIHILNLSSLVKMLDVQEIAAAPVGDELMLLFTARFPDPQGTAQMALFGASFNGLSLRWLRKLHEMERIRQPRLCALGAALYAAFVVEKPASAQERNYSSLQMASLAATQPVEEIVSYVDDIKYNYSPDLTLLNNSLWLVHEKWEFAPTSENPPPRYHGLFLGRVDFGPWRRPPEREAFLADVFQFLF